VREASVLLPEREPALQVEVNLAAALRHNVSPGDVRRDVTTLLSGLTVGNFFEQQRVFDVVVRGSGATHDSVMSVRNLTIDTPGGGHVRLGQLASVRVEPNPIDIQHDAVSRFIDVHLHIGAGNAGAIRAEIHRRLGRLRFPLEYHAELLALPSAAGTPASRFLTYLIAAAIAVFLLLQAAFASWRLAALVFSTLPLALVGGAIAALAIGAQSSLGAAAGLLTVLVVGARQVLVLVTDARRNQHGGCSLHDSVLGAASERLAPTLGFSLVATVVVMPFVAMGDVPGTEILHPMAVVILGGLITTVLLSLVIVPLVYLRLGPGPASEPAVAQAVPPPRDIRPQEV
jgi:Cu/Ag efflux pump CusA